MENLDFFPPSKDSQILERENNYLVETLEEGQRLLVALAASLIPIFLKLHLRLCLDSQAELDTWSETLNRADLREAS